MILSPPSPLSKGGWQPQPKKALRAILRRSYRSAEDSRNSPGTSGTEEKIVFLTSFSKPLIKGGRRPQTIKDGTSAIKQLVKAFRLAKPAG